MSYPCTEVLPGLYLGNKYDAQSCIAEHSVKAVINCTQSINFNIPSKSKLHYFKIPLRDSTKNAWKYKDLQLAAYITLNYCMEQNYKTLIHCLAGMSRSANVVILYLMIKNIWSYNQAFDFLKAKRKIIARNKWEQVTIANYNSLRS